MIHVDLDSDFTCIFGFDSADLLSWAACGHDEGWECAYGAGDAPSGTYNQVEVPCSSQ